MKSFLTFCWLGVVTASGWCLADEICYTSTQKPILQTYYLSFQNTSDQLLGTMCDAYKHRNNKTFHNNLHHYTAKQLQQYFNNNHYSEQKILDQKLLYLSDEFVKLAKTYAGYEQAIERLHKKFKNFGAFQKIIHTFTGTYSSGMKLRIERLYQEIQFRRAYQEKQNRTATQQLSLHQKHSLYDSHMSEYQELKPVYEQYSPLLAKAIERRMQVKDSFHQLQNVIHLESVDIIKEVNMLPTYSILHPHQSALIDCATVINDYNDEGILDKAMNIADFCWTLLDYGQAIAEGAALGLYATAQDFIKNPIEATVCIIAGKQVLAYQLCKVLYNVVDIGATAITDYDRAKEKWDDYIAPISSIVAAIEKKEITIRDSLKVGTAFVVGYKAQSKLLGGLGKFFTTIKQNAVRFAQTNISSFTVQQYLSTPEGYLLQAANKSCRSTGCPNQYGYLKEWLRIKEFTSIIDTTKHGIERLIERGFTPEDIHQVINFPSFMKIQSDEALVYIKQIQNNFNVIVLNQQTRKVATAIKNIDQKSLNDLGKNYGWKKYR